MATVTIKNLGKLTHKLNNVANMDVRKAVNKATTVVHGQAVNNAVFEKGYSKGGLKESIRMGVKKLPEGWQGRVYTNLEYAMYVEFGTGNRGDGSYPYKIDGLNLAYKQDWAGMTAQPYLYPALKTHEKYIKKLFKEEVNKKIKEYCKGGK